MDSCQKPLTFEIEKLKQFFDNRLSLIKNLTYTNKTTNGLDILTTICNDFSSIHALQLFDHPILINHQIFIYIGRTLEMLLTKSIYSQMITMNKYEENCLDTISYFITQLCSYRNETIELFYGSISNEIFPVTDKINIRDKTINENSRRSNPIANKPNLKISSLQPNAPKSRPIEQRQLDITKVVHRKKFPEQMISTFDEIKTEFRSVPTDLPLKRYQDVFLTKTFLDKLSRAIEDLSQNDYSSYHIKYKVIGRLVRLCSKLNITDLLFDSIIKCLRSKFYQQIFTSIQSEQRCLNPKQLFFINQCPQFIIQNEFQRQEQIPNLLCQSMIQVTKSIIDITLPNKDSNFDACNQGILLHTLHCHLELLNFLSLTSTGRQYFIQSNIIDQMINILRHDILSNIDENDELFYADVGIIVNTLMLLYNLSYEKQMFSILKRKDLQDIYTKLRSSINNAIKFTLTTLSTILTEDQIDEENEPMKLKKDYIEYLQKIIIKEKRIYNSGAANYTRERDDTTKHMALGESFLEALIRAIEDVSTTDYPQNKSIYKDISRRIRICTKQETNKVESLLNPILKCLNSEFYLQVFETIDFSEQKKAFGFMWGDYTLNLPSKHLFFMRDCPEFLFHHDYKQYDDIANSLGKKILKSTTKIFEEYLPILVGDEAKEDPDSEEACRIEALSYHIKMLTHFTQTRSMRKEFLQTSIVDQILLILQNRTLFDSGEHIAETKLGVIGQSLTLLYNLAFESEIYSQLQAKDVLKICSKLCLTKDKIIHFTSQILSIMLNKDMYDELNKPDLLSKTSIEYIDKSVKEPKQLYQGIKLDGLLKNVKIIVQNDSFTDTFVKDKNGIPAIAKCVYVNHPENPNLKMTERIQKTAIDIVWRLSHYGPIISKQLKENDKLIDQLLILLKETENKTKTTLDGIIWRLGNVENVQSELTKIKANQKEEEQDDDQLFSTDEWNKSISYDLFISYSNNVNDKILTQKIYSRLIKKGYQVCIEKQSKHRLQLMRKVITEKKLILACLSKSYRSSKACMAEIEYADKRSSPIIPIIVETNFKIQGWLKHIVGGKTIIDFTEKDPTKKLSDTEMFDKKLFDLAIQIENLKSSN